MEDSRCIICAMRGTKREGETVTSCIGNCRTPMVLCDEHQGGSVEVMHLDPQCRSIRCVLEIRGGIVHTKCFYDTKTLEVRHVWANPDSWTKDAMKWTKDVMKWNPPVGWTGGVSDSSHLLAPDIGPVHRMLVEHYKSPGKNVFDFQ